MVCDLCKEDSDPTIRVGCWQVCQSCMRSGAVARATEVEFDIAKLQEAVVRTSSVDQRNIQDKIEAASKLELAYDAYAALMTAMNELAVLTHISKARRHQIEV
jgi:hypothetical protein